MKKTKQSTKEEKMTRKQAFEIVSRSKEEATGQMLQGHLNKHKSVLVTTELADYDIRACCGSELSIGSGPKSDGWYVVLNRRSVRGKITQVDTATLRKLYEDSVTGFSTTAIILPSTSPDTSLFVSNCHILSKDGVNWWEFTSRFPTRSRKKRR